MKQIRAYTSSKVLRVAAPAQLKTKHLVAQLAAYAADYAFATVEAERNVAVKQAKSIFATYQAHKLDWPALPPQHQATTLDPKKIDSLARKLAATPGYTAADDTSFYHLVSPILAERLGLVALVSLEAGLAAAAHREAQALIEDNKERAEFYLQTRNRAEQEKDAMRQMLVRAEQTAAKSREDAAQLLAEAEQTAAKSREDAAQLLVEAAQSVAILVQDADTELYHARVETDALRQEKEWLTGENEQLRNIATEFLSGIPKGDVKFTTGAGVFAVDKKKLANSPYLRGLAASYWAERSDKDGLIWVSGITSEQLQAVTEFLETDLISGVEGYNRGKLLHIAAFFGNEAMERYVENPAMYRAEKMRLDGLKRPNIPEGYVCIEPGEFTIGSPPSEAGRNSYETQFTVLLKRPFLVKQTPVTQGEYLAIMKRNPSVFSQGPDAEKRPVENVSWYDSVAYCNALSEKDGLPKYYVIVPTLDRNAPDVRRAEGLDAARGWRILTRPEGEYSTRAGSSEALYDSPRSVSWFKDNAHGTTMPVGLKRPNAWNLYETVGDVSEWRGDSDSRCCQEWLYNPQDADLGALTRSGYANVSGASFSHPASDMRAAYFYPMLCQERSPFVGFRVARFFDQEPT